MARTPATSVAKTSPKAGALAIFNQQAELDALRSRLAAPTGDKISISNKQFKLPSGETLDFLDVIIMDFVYYNRYYENAFDPNTIVPPNCFSLSLEPKGMVPSANSPDIQHDNCSKCWANEFGSAGNGKACGNRVLLAVLPTDAGPETPFAILDISPTAIKGFGAYVNTVASALQRPPYGVISHIICNPTVKHDTVVFNAAEAVLLPTESLDEIEFAQMLVSRLGEARERLMTEPDVSSFEAANDAKKKTMKAPAKRRA